VKTPSTPVALALATGLLGLSVSGLAQAQEEQGRVISSTPVIQQVAVPRQVCTDQEVLVQEPKSGGGALLGAIAGGAAGNAIGNGGGRTAATVIGLIGGAMLGDRIEGQPQARTELVRNCGTQTQYENRTVAYDVVYEYAGRQYRTQMPQDPGRFVRLSVTPVDAMPPPPPAAVYPARPQVIYQTPYAPAPRVIMGTTVVPTYPLSAGIVYINGQAYHRPPREGWDRDRHWRDDDRRWDGDRRWRDRDDDRWHR
jgi:uncharacterized protein YcfJ